VIVSLMMDRVDLNIDNDSILSIYRGFVYGVIE